jgi:hypothetical protein
MSSDNVTPWVTEDPYSGELIICRPVASSFAQGTFKSSWAGFNLDWQSKHIRAFVGTFPTFSKTTSFYVLVRFDSSSWPNVRYAHPSISHIGLPFDVRLLGTRTPSSTPKPSFTDESECSQRLDKQDLFEGASQG